MGLELVGRAVQRRHPQDDQLAQARRQRRLLADGGQHGLPALGHGRAVQQHLVQRRDAAARGGDARFQAGQRRPRARFHRRHSACVHGAHSGRMCLRWISAVHLSRSDAISAASSCGELGAAWAPNSSRARGLAAQRRAHRLVELVHGGRRGGGRRHQPVPVVGLHAGDALLGQRLDVRQQRMARRRGDAQRLELAALDVPDQARHVAEEARHLVAHHIVDHRRRALVGHVHDLGAAGVGEHLQRQVRNAADAGRAHRHRLRVGLRALDEIGRIHSRVGRIDHEHGGVVDHPRDRREVARRIVGQVLVQRRADGHGADAGQEQHRAVARRLGHVGRGDIAVGAGLVLHDHLLLEFLAQLLGQHAAHQVHRAARREGDDQPHGRLGAPRRRRPAQQGGAE